MHLCGAAKAFIFLKKWSVRYWLSPGPHQNNGWYSEAQLVSSITRILVKTPGVMACTYNPSAMERRDQTAGPNYRRSRPGSDPGSKPGVKIADVASERCFPYTYTLNAIMSCTLHMLYQWILTLALLGSKLRFVNSRPLSGHHAMNPVSAASGIKCVFLTTPQVSLSSLFAALAWLLVSKPVPMSQSLIPCHRVFVFLAIHMLTS